MSSFVENASYTTKLLLSCSVPDLQLYDVFVICLEHKIVEFNPNGDVLAFIEVILHESKQNG